MIYLFPSRCCSAGLSPAERVRRLNTQSCLYCGTAGYYVSTCPFKRPNSLVGMSTLVGPKDNLASPTTRPPLPATLLGGDQSKSLQILIDSGADMSLMDVTLESELGIATLPFPFPVNVKALDGHFIGLGHPPYHPKQPTTVGEPQ